MSRKVREEIDAQLCIVPPVVNDCPIERYNQFATKLFEEAQAIQAKSSSAVDTMYKYVAWKKAVKFAVQLPEHNAYRLTANTKDRNRINRLLKEGMGHLEEVVQIMDAEVAESASMEESIKKEEELYDFFEDDANLTDSMSSVPSPALGLDVASTFRSPPRVESKNITARNVGAALETVNMMIPPSAQQLSAVFDALRLRGPELPVGACARLHSAPSPSERYVLPTTLGVSVDEGRSGGDIFRAFPVAQQPSPVEVGKTQFISKETSPSTSVDPEGVFAGISMLDLEILRFACANGGLRHFFAPHPYTVGFDVSFGSTRRYRFWKDDFHISFGVVLQTLPPSLQLSKAAVETNRCFFLHLGVAMGIHPFALQTAFRHVASLLLRSCTSTDAALAKEILPSVLEYAGFVDANVLFFLWPEEFRTSRILMISGAPTRPMFSVFSLRGAAPDSLRDVIIHCNGSHFTLLRPVTPVNELGRHPSVSNRLSRARCYSSLHSSRLYTFSSPSGYF